MHPSESTARLLVAVLVFGGTALIIAILTWRRPSADGPITPGCWWGLPYGFGAVSVAFGLLVPEPEWREPMWDGGPPFTLAITLTGLGLLLVGAVIHVVFWRLGKLTGGRGERAWLATAALVFFATVVFRGLTLRGVNVDRWLGLLAVGAAVLTLLLLGLAALAAIHKWWPHVEFPGKLKTVGELAGMAVGLCPERCRPDIPWTRETVRDAVRAIAAETLNVKLGQLGDSTRFRDLLRWRRHRRW
jgi:hypothetical protein